MFGDSYVFFFTTAPLLPSTDGPLAGRQALGLPLRHILPLKHDLTGEGRALIQTKLTPGLELSGKQGNMAESKGLDCDTTTCKPEVGALHSAWVYESCGGCWSSGITRVSDDGIARCVMGQEDWCHIMHSIPAMIRQVGPDSQGALQPSVSPQLQLALWTTLPSPAVPELYRARAGC